MMQQIVYATRRKGNFLKTKYFVFSCLLKKTNFFSFTPSVIDAIDDENSDSYSDPPSLDPIIPFDTDTFSSINSSKLQPIILDYSLNKHQSNENVPEEAGDSSSSNTPHEGN